MLRSFSVLVLAFMLATNSSASTVGAPSIQQVFDELEYGLSVEWDQQNQEFYRLKIDEFNSKISLLKQLGVSNDEILEVAIRGIKNESLSKEIRSIVNLLSVGQLSTEDFQKLINQAIEKHPSLGAAWAGEVAVLGGIFLGSILFGLLLIQLAERPISQQPTPTPSPGGNSCRQYQCGWVINQLGYSEWACGYVINC